MAELTGCDGVLELLKQIYETLQEYEQQTDAMINAELEVLQQSLLARNDLITRLEALKQELESIVELELPEERLLLQTLIHGSYVSAELDDKHKEIQLVQRNITVIKQRIVDKDKVISGQFKNQHIDSRRELEQLKQTRQKIGYYNSAVVNRATGQSLNKNL
ncbi:MAG: hypothetical protein J6B57_05945 [Oscillospiraceae bacterium]|nr:hypothetical protein [Oscillospiraceae bacterium]